MTWKIVTTDIKDAPRGYGFNDNHPECGPDEIWVGNWYPNRPRMHPIDGDEDTNPRPAGRAGVHAYDKYGNPQPMGIPFFRKKDKTDDK